MVEKFDTQNISNAPPPEITDIEETDIRKLALKFQTILSEKQSFNQGISHELRTPLQVMKNSIVLMNETYDGLKSDANFHSLTKATRRMERISTAFLWLTNTKDHKEECDVEDCLAEVIAETTPKLTKQSIALEVDMQGNPKVVMPKEVLELILFNLIGNVIQHAPNEQLTIKLNSVGVKLQNSLTHSKENAKGFDLGLTIVNGLANRFGFQLETSLTDESFTASLLFTPPQSLSS